MTIRNGMRVMVVTLACVWVLPMTSRGDIWVGRWEKDHVVGSTIRRVSPEDGNFFQPMMHPDGTKVVFWGRPAGAERHISDIWVANVDGTDVHRVTKDQARNDAPCWTSDGRIVFASRRGGEPGPRIWVMDADGSNARQVTTGDAVVADARPCVSPDGLSVVFCSNRAGGREPKLWRVPLAGGEPEQVTKGPGAHHRPVFSHDGRRLAFFTTDSPVKRFNLAVMDWPDGKPVQPVTLGPPRDNLRGPFWMRDNKHVMVHGRLGASPSIRLYVIEVATGKWRTVDVPGSVSSGHGSLDREEKWITFDGARVLPTETRP